LAGEEEEEVAETGGEEEEEEATGIRPGTCTIKLITHIISLCNKL
jgi:hypothetical protein